MERGRTSQFRASEASVANSTAFSFNTGNAPGRPRQTGQTFVFGSAPNLFAQPQNALVAVSNWTCTSRPITGSYLARISGDKAAEAIDEFSPGATHTRLFRMSVWMCSVLVTPMWRRDSLRDGR